MRKLPRSSVGVLVDFDGQLSEIDIQDRIGEDGMPRGLETHIEACKHCEYSDEPTFAEQRRVSYRQVGEEGDYAYSRSISIVQEVLVCLSCGEVHKVLNEIK